MEFVDGKYRLSSGKIISPNRDIIGINPKLEISEGYDQMIHEHDMDGHPVFTTEDRREIADYMIGLWEQFAHGAEPQATPPER